MGEEFDKVKDVVHKAGFLIGILPVIAAAWIGLQLCEFGCWICDIFEYKVMKRDWRHERQIIQKSGRGKG